MKLFGKGLVILIDSYAMNIELVSFGRRSQQPKKRIVVNLPIGAVEDGVIRDAEGVAELLRGALRENRLTAVRRVVFCLCSTQVLAVSVAVPEVETKWLGRMIRTNRDIYFPVNTENHEIAYLLTGRTEDEDGKPALAVRIWATPRELLRGYYQVANDCGLSVAAIDYCGESFLHAMGASWTARAKTASEDVELRLLAETDFLLMTFFGGGKAVMQRYLRRDGAFGGEMGEVRLALEMYLSDEGVRGEGLRAVLYGEMASDGEYVADLRDALGVDVEDAGIGREAAWFLCDGASCAAMDFGDPAMNASKHTSPLSRIWQSLVLGVGVAAVCGGALAFVLPALLSRGRIAQLDESISAKELEYEKVSDYASRYEAYLDTYTRYLSDWQTIQGYHENGGGDEKSYVPGVLQTYNDNLDLIFDELESTLPKNCSVVGMRAEDGAAALEIASATKSDAVDLLLSLRYNLKYSTLDGDFIPSLTQGEGIPVSDDSISDALAAILTPEEEPPKEGGTDDLNQDDKNVLKGILDKMSEAELRTVYTMLIMESSWDYSTDDYRNIFSVIKRLSDDEIDVLAKSTGWLKETSYTLEELLGRLESRSQEEQFTVKRTALTDMFENPFAMYLFMRDLVRGVRDKDSELYYDAATVALFLMGDEEAGAKIEQLIKDDSSGGVEDMDELLELRERIPEILSRDADALEAAVTFARKDERLRKYYAYYLARAMDLLDSGGGQTPGGSQTPDWGQSSGDGSGSGTKSDGKTPVVDGNRGGQSDSAGKQTPADQAPAAEETPAEKPQDTRYYTTVILVYNDAMIDAEPERRGLDPDGYVPRLEVEE